MLNHIDLGGRMTRDPELRRTQSGKAVTSFTVACERDFGGENRETDFIDVVAWNSLAEFVERNFKRGKLIFISGRLQFREWTDKDGNKRRNAEVLADNVYFGGDKSEAKPVAVTAENFKDLDDDADLPF